MAGISFQLANQNRMDNFGRVCSIWGDFRNGCRFFYSDCNGRVASLPDHHWLVRVE